MVLAHLSTPTAPSPGDKCFSAAFGDQAAGEVANVAPALGGGFDLLIVAQIGAINENNLRYASADGIPLIIKPLPYEVPLAQPA